ncbi:MAG TPA: reverse transcriptase domain-containing protein, partial [Candidatus Limnocylindrales bacterium]|nr:reverse transcriptase domain-containing protein [Candidatus Limnocylindrales bacterium]
AKVEPFFHPDSYGYRPRRSAYDAVAACRQRCWKSDWVIDLDIQKFFGSLSHDVMVRILAEKIHDNRFLRLIANMLKAGYLEDWRYHETLSGCPQGGVVSPILSNVYLDKLDKFVEQVLIPQHAQGRHRKTNPEYRRLNDRRQYARKRGDRAAARELLKRMRAVPCGDPMDPEYRRLRYCRYADDHILGFTGPKAQAEDIKNQLAAFLRDELALELSAEKTLITHARTGAARFLGYEITVRHDNSKITGGRRMLNGTIALRVPLTVIRSKCAPYRRRGKPWCRPALINLSDYDIVRVYAAEYRGVVNYYPLAGDAWRLHALRWNAETSMLKTLAAKHQSTVTKTAARYKATVETPHGPRTCFEARIPRTGKKDLVARFGGIPLRRNENGFIIDPVSVPVPTPRKELIHRLRTRRCELCEQDATVAVHQIAKLARLGTQGPNQPAWAALMTRKRRKTLVVCQPCHEAIHATPATHAA